KGSAAPVTASPDAKHLVCLDAEPPPRVREAILDGESGVAFELRAVHGLEVEEPKLERFEGRRWGSFLRIDELDLVTLRHHEPCPRLWTHTYPVDPCGHRDGAVGLDGDGEPCGVQGVDEWRVELEEGFAAGANDERRVTVGE